MKNIYTVTLLVDKTKLLQSFSGSSSSNSMIQQAIVDAIEWDEEAGIEVDNIKLNRDRVACEHCNTTIRIGEEVISVDHKSYCSISCLHSDIDVITGKLTKDDIVGGCHSEDY